MEGNQKNDQDQTTRNETENDLHRQRVLRMLENQRRYMEVAENSAHLLQMLSRVIPGTGEMDMESESSDCASESSDSSSQGSTPSPTNYSVTSGEGQSMWSDPVMQLLQLPYINDVRQRFSTDTYQATPTSRPIWRSALPLQVTMEMLTSQVVSGGAMVSELEQRDVVDETTEITDHQPAVRCSPPPSEEVTPIEIISLTCQDKEIETKQTSTKQTATKETANKVTSTRETASKETSTRGTMIKETATKETATKETITKEKETKTASTKETNNTASQTVPRSEKTTSTQTWKFSLNREESPCSESTSVVCDGVRDLKNAGLSLAATQSGLNNALHDLNTAADTIRQTRELLAVFGSQTSKPTDPLEKLDSNDKDIRFQLSGRGDTGDDEHSKHQTFPTPLLVKAVESNNDIKFSAKSGDEGDALGKNHSKFCESPRTSQGTNEDARPNISVVRRVRRYENPWSRTSPVEWSANLEERKKLAESVRKYPRVWGNLKIDVDEENIRDKREGNNTHGGARSVGIGENDSFTIPVEDVEKTVHVSVAVPQMFARNSQNVNNSDSNSSNSSSSTSTGSTRSSDSYVSNRSNGSNTDQKDHSSSTLRMTYMPNNSVRIVKSLRRTITDTEVEKALDIAIHELRKINAWTDSDSPIELSESNLRLKGLCLDLTNSKYCPINSENNSIAINDTKDITNNKNTQSYPMLPNIHIATDKSKNAVSEDVENFTDEKISTTDVKQLSKFPGASRPMSCHLRTNISHKPPMTIRSNTPVRQKPIRKPVNQYIGNVSRMGSENKLESQQSSIIGSNSGVSRIVKTPGSDCVLIVKEQSEEISNAHSDKIRPNATDVRTIPSTASYSNSEGRSVSKRSSKSTILDKPIQSSTSIFSPKPVPRESPNMMVISDIADCTESLLVDKTGTTYFSRLSNRSKVSRKSPRSVESATPKIEELPTRSRDLIESLAQVSEDQAVIENMEKRNKDLFIPQNSSEESVAIALGVQKFSLLNQDKWHVTEEMSKICDEGADAYVHKSWGSLNKNSAEVNTQNKEVESAAELWLEVKGQTENNDEGGSNVTTVRDGRGRRRGVLSDVFRRCSNCLRSKLKR